VLLLYIAEVKEYEDLKSKSPFGDWLNDLDPQTAAKVTTAITRLSLGNWSNVKGAGKGVFEYKIDYGPGYRIYFGKDGPDLVILLAGGTKRRQSADIQKAQKFWVDYKKRKKQEKDNGTN